jgi:hypothetical protein
VAPEETLQRHLSFSADFHLVESYGEKNGNMLSHIKIHVLRNSKSLLPVKKAAKVRNISFIAFERTSEMSASHRVSLPYVPINGCKTIT